jgi:hypothetical protein
MLKSALHKGTLLTVLLRLVGWGGLLAVAGSPASAQFKAWVMAKFPDRPWGLRIDSKDDLVNPFHLSCRDATATHSGTDKIDARTRQVAPGNKGGLFCRSLCIAQNIPSRYPHPPWRIYA